MTHVYLVEGYVMYESSNVIAAFDLERDAIAFSKRCKDHDARKPRCPTLECHDDVWDRYNRAEKNWVKRHPAKRTGTADDYPVYGIKVRPAVWAKEKKVSTSVD